jgi:hypothetical protein
MIFDEAILNLMMIMDGAYCKRAENPHQNREVRIKIARPDQAKSDLFDCEQNGHKIWQIIGIKKIEPRDLNV